MRKIETISGTAQDVISSTKFRIDGKAITFPWKIFYGSEDLNISEGDMLTIAGTNSETGFRATALHNHTINATYGRPSQLHTAFIVFILLTSMILSLLIVGIPFLIAAILLLYLDFHARKSVKLIEQKIVPMKPV
jgi:hypothetical protein